MKVTLRHHTPLFVAIEAIRTCWDSKDKMDSSYDKLGSNDLRLINTILKNEHTSTLEHIVYNFHIKDISRLCLQELVRHRIASFSVKSSRYTLKELRTTEHLEDFIVPTNNTQLNNHNVQQLRKIQELLNQNVSNDTLKYLIPEAYKTELYFSINARSLRNLLSLRSKGNAHFEIQKLALELYNKIPNEHKVFFEDLKLEVSK